MSHAEQTGYLTADVMAALQRLAPAELAEPWDVIGLQTGSPLDRIQAVLVALDVTPEVMQLAIQQQAGLIIVHHPAIFQPLSALRSDEPAQALIIDLVSHNIGVLAAHTNLDVAPDGVADSLAACLADCLPLDPSATSREEIARYGRVLRLKRSLPLSELAGLCQSVLGAAGCQFNTDRDLPIRSLAVFPGSFAEEAVSAVRQSGVDCVVCGESKHSTGQLLRLCAISQICVGHDVSERVVLQPLAAQLRIALPDLPFAVHEGLVYNEIAFRVNRTAAGAGRKAAREESPGSKGQGAG